MAPSSPTRVTWILGLILGILGIIGHFAAVPFISEYNYMLLLIGYVLLALGTTVRGI